MDRVSATETTHLGLIRGRVKPKTIKIDIYSFSAWRLVTKGEV